MHASMQPSLQLPETAFDLDIKGFNCAAAERTECWYNTRVDALRMKFGARALFVDQGR
jgi:hypothetical protein